MGNSGQISSSILQTGHQLFLSRCMIERAECQFQEAIASAIYRKYPNWNRNASHFRQTDVIVEAIVLEEIKLLNRCHTRDLSFQKRETLINSKKPSLMRSPGSIRTETEMPATTVKLTLLGRLSCLKERNFFLEIDAMRENLLWRHSQFSIFAYFGWTYFHLQKKYVTSQILVWEKITYFLLIFPRGGKFIHLPATS